MKQQFKTIVIAGFVMAILLTNAFEAGAKERYTLGSLAEGTTPYTVNTAWASAVNKYVDGHEIQVSAVGAATRHALLVTQRKMDFTMFAGSIYNLMFKQIGPYKKIENGPELLKKVNILFSYPIGFYQAVVYAKSGIKTFHDIKGKKVFLGPPAGVATRNTTLIIDAMTGYKPGKDFEQIKMGWSSAAQAFQDKKFDVWITTTSVPSPQVQQLTLTNKIRLLSLDKSKFDHPSWKKYVNQPGRFVNTIDPRKYGKNMMNTEPVLATGAWVGLAVRSDMSEELVYQMMKAFWGHLDDAYAMAVYMKSTISLEQAVTALAGDVHPGALRYYREKGIKVPKPFTLEKK
jgi:TRAP transporter TAXI family solute receptor